MRWGEKDGVTGPVEGVTRVEETSPVEGMIQAEGVGPLEEMNREGVMTRDWKGIHQNHPKYPHLATLVWACGRLMSA